MVKDIENDFNSGLSRATRILGSTASITIITLILYLLKVIPENVSLAIGFFVSLPLVWSFIFGIIFNKPNFASSIRHYFFLGYVLLALAIFLVVLKPSSIIEGVRFFVQFLLGLILASVGYFFYSVGYRFSKRINIEMYRWITLISFGVSFIITLIIAFLLKYFNIFDLI